MASNEERLAILRMIEEGKISAEEGTRLITALSGDTSHVVATGQEKARYLRVRVTDLVTGQQKVSINLPVAVVTIGLRFIPESAGVDKQALLDAIEQGMTGRIVDVQDSDDGTHVEVFLE